MLSPKRSLNHRLSPKRSLTQMLSPKRSLNQMLTTTLTCAEAFSNPDEVPSDSGKVNSAANSKPTGRYPVIKNLKRHPYAKTKGNQFPIINKYTFLYSASVGNVKTSILLLVFSTLTYFTFV